VTTALASLGSLITAPQIRQTQFRSTGPQLSPPKPKSGSQKLPEALLNPNQVPKSFQKPSLTQIRFTGASRSPPKPKSGFQELPEALPNLNQVHRASAKPSETQIRFPRASGSLFRSDRTVDDPNKEKSFKRFFSRQRGNAAGRLRA